MNYRCNKGHYEPTPKGLTHAMYFQIIRVPNDAFQEQNPYIVHQVEHHLVD